MNGPKVSAFVALVKFGYMLENPSIPWYSPQLEAVTNHGVRTISRKGSTRQSRILRDHTPNIRSFLDEDMVRTAWRHAERGRDDRATALQGGATTSSEIPCRVSSDPHEWRNDLSAVSTRGSAKLNWP